MKTLWSSYVLAALLLALCSLAAQGADRSAQQIRAATGKIDDRAIQANARSGRDWPSYGLDYAETRFSRLAGINAGNVKNLGLVWSYNLESARGVEATPVVVDGVMYVTASWSIVHAVDVRTGKRLWTYDPKVDRMRTGYKGCCDVVNRGVAVYQGKVYVGAFDGRLVALDAADGKVVWEKDTIIDRARHYTITGAPRVVKGNVIIGNGGAEYGVRGYVTAYDARTGAQKWRWFTVPGDPAKPYEDASMARAAQTWDPSNKYWEAGGGGTAWDSFAFDPELNLLYVGTGNGAPWAQSKRSPAGGDNLYLASIVALDADTGQYAWHYQETPGDSWDYTSTQTLILADLKIDGKLRKVVMHAPKNGFFFVVDRTNGRFISAKNFVDVNWATGYDQNGRPMVTPLARQGDKPREVIPGVLGAHNWMPMSFNPQTGLVYLPAQQIPITLMDDKNWAYNAKSLGETGTFLGWNTGSFGNVEPPKSKPFGRLIAWDPVQQKEVWRQEHASPWNGGTLTTAGNLVFQGSADGRFVAYNAKTGEKLWETPTASGIVAAPSTYLVDGKQYVSIAVGWGGFFGQITRYTDIKGPGTVYTFALGGSEKGPEAAAREQGTLVQGVKYDAAQVQHGRLLYQSNCAACHGAPGALRGGNIKNLGYSAPEVIGNLDRFVFNGPYGDRGMPDFTGVLTNEQLEQIKAFIQGNVDALRPKN
jgi:quinohemoprotein ethanol dehydrogenase